ncbi:MAG: cysteine desulfurase [Clostridia bacterium]|nr:cysteine desulfurase [Clostridia bacterium]
MKKLIYLDNSATTRLCPEAAEAMTDALSSFANPSSLHSAGAEAADLLGSSRRTLLAVSGLPEGFTAVFTGSGSAANNLALIGAGRSGKHFSSRRIILTDSEHPSVNNTVAALEREGFEAVMIPTPGGRLDEKVFSAEIAKGAAAVSLMLVNNETGAYYGVEEAFAEARRVCPGALMHCDAVQGFMRVPLPGNADMITVSAHKIHGPKGVGALFLSRDVIKKKSLSPLIYGGGQESGLVSGTENTPGIAGFSAAAAAAASRRAADSGKLALLRRMTVDAVEKAGARVNIPYRRVDHIVSVTLPGIKSQTMLNYLSAGGICVSSGSACSSHDRRISRSLKAFGLSDADADCTVRVSLSAENTPEEIEAFGERLAEGISRLVRAKR